ncbi:MULTISPECIES: NADH-quinone oxidoreductase subunit NuoG [unclassified Psychrobacter]|uniref:NADH-quinone oxidoreductase subunit NuoG n=1 Tax=unclassified Psychrobacter TaxID=196806 RepID=UPI0025B5BE14|nr:MULTISPECIES: NADH-quinone oxidoreductase subunit NuoG [unclassified Psychrobacter]MDN3452058.1 NADH-quinone oxidoreductase subunit NuoG [Psychrobacter sp. APC 3350]MDN3501358.1 NADH-quinone oxidoreductase subunit NuoG [Psychrobacter sp. 5A.1]
MAVIHIDGTTVEVDSADNLLQACLSLGIDVPYFCYHPALGSVGSCRQCAVKQFQNKEDMEAGRGRLVMSCMVAPGDDMYISVTDDEAKAFRKSMVELLMTNHPHDCPTCEEGGHCHLQDMTYMSGHSRRRYRFTKRTHHNQELGPFIAHEMNRCIACYRCVRFYKDYAGGEDLGVYGSNNRVYFGRDKDGQFESEFSGNLTEVCPTGVFTDKTHSERYNRKWDMQYAPSICHGCSAGCNISPGERYGELRRIENRYNGEVNRYFLCDRGRFGYGYVNRDDRPTQALERINDKHVKINIDYALDETIKRIKDKKVIGIGSPRASLETNFALKNLVGFDKFSTGLNHQQQALVNKCIEVLSTDGIYNPSMTDIESHDAVLVLGEDITQTSSRVALSVRQAAKNEGLKMAAALQTQPWLAEPVKRIAQDALSPVYVIDVTQTKLEDISKVSVVATPEDITKLGFKVADEIASFADDLAEIADPQAAEQDADASTETDGMQVLAQQIAYDLIQADKPLVISGSSLSSTALIEAAAQITQALTQKRAAIKATEQQQVEAHNAKVKAANDQPEEDQDLSAKPNKPETGVNTEAQDDVERAPAEPLELKEVNNRYQAQAGIYLTVTDANSMGVCMLGGQSVEELLATDFDVVIVAENQLTDAIDANKLTQLLTDKTVIALDHQLLDWHKDVDIVLPAASFAEADGTLISAEGRAQRFFQVYDNEYYHPMSSIKEGWRWLHAVHSSIEGRDVDWTQLDDVINALIATHPKLAGIKGAAPDAAYRMTGLKIARQPRRYSGRTAMRAPISVHEPMQPKDLDTGLTFSMEGYSGKETPSSMIPFANAAGWNSPQAWNKYQDKVGGSLKNGDPGVRLFDQLARLETRQYVAPEAMSATTTDMQQGQAKLVPIYNIYASSMMASRSPIVAEQLPVAAWRIGMDDAKDWNIAAGDYLAIEIDKQQITLPVQIVGYLAEGCIGYPVGQVSIIHPSMPASVRKVDAPVTMMGSMANDMMNNNDMINDNDTAQMNTAPITTQEV